MAQLDGAGLVARCLRAAGVRRLFVAPGHGLEPVVDAAVAEGLPVLSVADDGLAAVLADASGALGSSVDDGPGAALLGGRRLRLSSDPGARCDAIEVTVDDVPAAVAGWSMGRGRSAVEYVLPAVLDAPVDASLRPLMVRRDDRLVRLSADLTGLRTVLLIGARVVREGAADDVVGAARRAGATVVSTPGAVGVVQLSDPAWCGVVGVQRDDAMRSGLADAELVLAVGVDDDEPGASIPDTAHLVDLEPWHLAFLALDWPLPDAPSGRSSTSELADVLVAHRADDSSPIHPVRAALDVLDAVDASTRVAVDAGPIGLWFVRGVLPVAAGRVVVPMRATDGFATAAALSAALDGQRVVALTTPGDPVTPALLGLAADLGLDLVVEQWGDDVGVADASGHRAALVGALVEGGVHLLGVAVDLAAATELVERSGPVVLWD